MSSEVELAAVGRGGAGVARVSAQAERVLGAFYDAQREKFLRQRQRLEQTLGQSIPSGTQAAARGCTAKWNRQELYLQEGLRERAASASRRHLSRHESWLHGKTKLDDQSLREHIALQHYIDVDLEDLRLPMEERRSEDSFVGVGADICEQLLLDATRSVYVIAGEKFDFSDVVRDSGMSTEQTPTELDHLREAFANQLVSAVQRCLGPDPLQVLSQVITMTMSQSGLANVERACDDTQVVVCGGDQIVQYSLQPSPLAIASSAGDSSRNDGSWMLAPSAWDVELSVKKFGFEQCIICSGAGDMEDPTPKACSSKSFLSKSCRLRYSLRSCNSDDSVLEADVLDLHKETLVIDCAGQLLLPNVGVGNRSGLFVLRILNFAVQCAMRLCGRCLSGSFATCCKRNIIGCCQRFVRRPGTRRTAP